MTEKQLSLDISQFQLSEVAFINSRCLLRKEEDQRVVIVAGLPIHHYFAGDAVAEAYVMVSLVDSGLTFRG